MSEEDFIDWKVQFIKGFTIFNPHAF